MNNGNLKSLYSFWVGLATNHRYSAYVKQEDLDTFATRSANEGISFLTTTLPLIGKALDRFHATAAWDQPLHFKCDSNAIPYFLGNAIKRALLGDSLAVDCVRQLTYVFYKLEVEHDKGTVDQFLGDFVKVDSEIDQAYDPRIVNKTVYEHVASMRRIVKRILCNTDPLDIRPCHGSGATACHTANSDKWHKLRYYPKLDAVYSYADYFFYSMTHLVDEFDKLEGSACSVPRARAVLVPKDSRGPRIISCEPAELMFIQQGLMRLMYSTLENHPLTHGQINFTDQTINRRLARQASLDGIHATIDLSEASDRVSLRLVREVFPSNWFECLSACRSEETELPNGVIVKLNKFATMGSAVCFPVEALVFWASTQATISRLGLKYSTYVYGDDIIVPAFICAEIIEDLESIGLVVNKSKTFTKGPFRESCGGDYHNGCDVAPVRVKKFFGTSNTAIATGADLINNLVSKFGYDECKTLIDIIESEVEYVYPRTELCYPGTILFPPVASNDVFFQRRWNLQYQRYEHRILTSYTKALALRQPTWSELLRTELTVVSRGDHASTYPFEPMKVGLTESRVGKYAASHAARTKWAWVWLG